MKTYFLNEQDREYEEKRNGEENIFSGANSNDENNELQSEIEANNELNIGNATSGDKRKVIVAPHRKAKQVRSNKQTLTQWTHLLQLAIDSTVKFHVESSSKLR